MRAWLEIVVNFSPEIYNRHGISSNGDELAKFYGSRSTADERYRTAMEEEADHRGKFFLIQKQ